MNTDKSKKATDEAVADEKINDEAVIDTSADKDIETAAEAESDAEAKADDKSAESGEKGKSKIFGKKDKKDKKDEKIDELNDKLMRMAAEYDNYRKRTDKEKTAMFDMGAKTIIEKVIPLIDNFERGFASVTDDNKDDPFVKGMKKVYDQFISTLDEAGVEVIEAEGKEFDPNLHNAVMHVDDDSFGDNVVAEELQKGYKYKDNVIRYSMVKVAN